MRVPWKPPFGGSKSPDRVAPRSGGLTQAAVVATPEGWCPVERLVAGTLVLTFDAGLKPLRGVQRRQMWAQKGPSPELTWPLDVPRGVLGNRSPVLLPPDLNLLVESDLAEQLYGDPFVLIPIKALDGMLGIERKRPDGPLEVVNPIFDTDQVVFANGATLVHCPAVPGQTDAAYNLLRGKAARDVAQDFAANGAASCDSSVLSGQAARAEGAKRS